MSDDVTGRAELALNWIPNMCGNLLDCGCSTGKYVASFAKKVESAYGIDPNEEFIKKARTKYNNICFKVAYLENLPFKSDFFNTITALEVIEHVQDDKKAVDEIYRVLKKGGTLILTTPNKGLFSFLDQDNYVHLTVKYAPFLYKVAYFIKKRKWLKELKLNPGYENKHRHYSLKDLKKLLDNKFEIKQVFRSGLILAPLSANLKLFITTLFGDKVYSKYLEKYVNYIISKEYCLYFGSLSYYIAIKAIKF
ncbi:class I SAM-dependent methyltransferase [Candidatus Woesearchaeota archaeon]|nr:class I SAM-dependent methyltransferase [Candidatus Woesearchaeota archaeon]